MLPKNTNSKRSWHATFRTDQRVGGRLSKEPPRFQSRQLMDASNHFLPGQRQTALKERKPRESEWNRFQNSPTYPNSASRWPAEYPELQNQNNWIRWPNVDTARFANDKFVFPFCPVLPCEAANSPGWVHESYPKSFEAMHRQHIFLSPRRNGNCFHETVCPIRN